MSNNIPPELELFGKAITEYHALVDDLQRDKEALLHLILRWFADNEELANLRRLCELQHEQIGNLKETVAKQQWVTLELQACERDYHNAIDDYERAREQARIWKAEAKHLWGKLHYGKDKVPSAEERAKMPPLCDYCHSRHYSNQGHIDDDTSGPGEDAIRTWDGSWGVY